MDLLTDFGGEIMLAVPFVVCVGQMERILLVLEKCIHFPSAVFLSDFTMCSDEKR